jgi:hypothetical protein
VVETLAGTPAATGHFARLAERSQAARFGRPGIEAAPAIERLTIVDGVTIRPGDAASSTHD